MVPNSWKIDLWSCLGALWAPFWRQDGPRATARPRKHERYKIFEWLQDSQMLPKSVEKVIKNRVDFRSDFETTSFRSWIDFGPKNRSKMKGLRIICSTSLQICEKCDFEQPSIVFAIFFDFGGVGFRPEKVYFSVVFSTALLRRTFFDFGSNFGPHLRPNGSQNRWKNRSNFELNF